METGKPAWYDTELELWGEELSEMCKIKVKHYSAKGMQPAHIAMLMMDLFLAGYVRSIIGLTLLAEDPRTPSSPEEFGARFEHIKNAVEGVAWPILEGYVKSAAGDAAWLLAEARPKKRLDN